MANVNQEFDDEWTEQDLQRFSDEQYDSVPALQVNESIDLVNLGDKDNIQEVQIVNGPEKDQIVQLCHEFKEVFAWTYRDMPGLDPSIATHKIPTRPDIQNKVKQEVMKLLESGFIRVANYPEWVANIVPVPKKGGKIRICVDYRDLNKASPKDYFPIPHIDMVVDSAAKHMRLSLVDG